MKESSPVSTLRANAPLTFGQFFRSLVRALVQQGVSPCILRNYEGFPESNVGNDVDFMIHPAELPLVIRAIQSIDEVRIVGFNQQFHVAMFFIQGISQTPGVRSFQVDFIRSFTWKGMPYLSTEVVLKDAVQRQVDDLIFLVPSPVHEAIISLLTSLVVSGFVKEKYFPKVQRTFAADREGVIACLSGAFGSKQAVQLANAAIAGNRQEILACIKPLRAALALRNITSRPIQSAIAVVRHHLIVLDVRFSPRTLETVCIVGPGTVAKSAIVNSLVPLLEYSAANIERHNTTACHQLQTEATGLQPMAVNSPASITKLSLRLIGAWQSQFRGRRNLTLRLCDGSFCDLAIDPQKFGFNGPKWFALFLCALFPSPDFWILLDALPGSLPAENGEIAATDSRTQVNSYRAFLSATRNHVILNAAQSADQVTEDAYAAVIDFLSSRTEKRLKGFA